MTLNTIEEALADFKEGKFLIDTARQEYFFKEDRNIQFTKSQE